MTKPLKLKIAAALEARGLKSPDAALAVAEELPDDECRQLAADAIENLRQTLIRRLPADPRQGWLALPEYQHVSPEVATEGLEELRARIRRLEKRIGSYDYARRSPEKLKDDKAELRELKRIENQTATLFAGAPNLDVDSAMNTYRASLETPKVRRWSKGGKAKNRSTKNQ